jgi:hypothetical protein
VLLAVYQFRRGFNSTDGGGGGREGRSALALADRRRRAEERQSALRVRQ